MTQNTELKSFNYYWIKHVFEDVWRPAYVGEDADGNQYISTLSTTKITMVKDMMLQLFEIIPLEVPND